VPAHNVSPLEARLILVHHVDPGIDRVAAGVNPHFFAGTLRRADASRHLGWPSVTDQ
jgi:hypothetical protein